MLPLRSVRCTCTGAGTSPIGFAVVWCFVCLEEGCTMLPVTTLSSVFVRFLGFDIAIAEDIVHVGLELLFQVLTLQHLNAE